MRFQVQQQGAVAALFPSQTYIINAQHPRSSLISVVGQRMEQPEQRVGTDWNTGLACQASAALAPTLKCERGQQFSSSVGAPSIPGEHTVETLGEDLAWAVGHIAEPSTAMYPQPHGVATPGQIEWTSVIAAVLASTQLPTIRARNGLACRFDNQDQAAVALDDDQDDAPVIGLRANRFGHRHPPSMPKLARSATDRNTLDILSPEATLVANCADPKAHWGLPVERRRR